MLMDIGLNLIITLFIYLTIPMIYAGWIGRVHKKKASKIALYNSIIGCIIACIIRAFVTGGEVIFSSLLPATFYFFIARWMLTDKYAKEEIHKSRVKDLSSVGGKFVINNDSSNEVREDSEISVSKIMNEVIVKDHKIQDRKIYKLQISMVVLTVVLILFSIIYPLSIISCGEHDVDHAYKQNDVKLSEINVGQKVYCVTGEKQAYIYVISEYGDVLLYTFDDYSRYSSNKVERVGYATLSDLKEYFGPNLVLGRPKPRDVYKFAIPLGIIIPLVGVIAVIVMGVIIHRSANEDIYILFNTDEFLKSLRQQYKDDKIPKSYYNRERRIYYSQEILKENKFFSLFKFLY